MPMLFRQSADDALTAISKKDFAAKLQLADGTTIDVQGQNQPHAALPPVDSHRKRQPARWLIYFGNTWCVLSLDMPWAKCVWGGGGLGIFSPTFDLPSLKLSTYFRLPTFSIKLCPLL